MKKMECIIEKSFLDPLLDFLYEHNIQGYSVVEISRGRSPQKGSVKDLGFISITRNYFVISICSDEDYNNIKQPLSKYIKNYDGMVYFSDVEVPE